MEEKKEVSIEQTSGGTHMSEKTTTSAMASEDKGVFQAYHLVYYILGVVEVLLAFRLVFKLLGANPNSGFVSSIYTLSGIFLAPFRGIFRSATSAGVETTSVFEPATVIAMVVYLIIGWGIARLLDVLMAGKE